MAHRRRGPSSTCLLPNTDRAGDRIVADRILSRVRALSIKDAGNAAPGTITVSLGIGVRVPGKGETGKTLVDLADKALYLAKAIGRNQVQ